jgi:hypothetical protein
MTTDQKLNAILDTVYQIQATQDQMQLTFTQKFQEIEKRLSRIEVHISLIRKWVPYDGELKESA